MSVVFTPLLTATVAPAAWRLLQGVPAEVALGASGSLQGAPPCLATLEKVGKGHAAAWRLADFRTEETGIQARLALDRNPAEPCCKLMFVGGRSGQREKLGHMLLACDEDGSALRGMRIREDLRGRGLSKLLLAVWLRLCLEAGLTPRTRTINKPLLSLSLAAFGFAPTNQRGMLVRVSAAKRARDCVRSTSAHAPGRTAYIRTAFEVPSFLLPHAAAYSTSASAPSHPHAQAPDAATLRAAVDRQLRHGNLELGVPSAALRRALTLRGGRGACTPKCRGRRRPLPC